MIIVDNSVLSFLFQLDNGVPILPFYTNRQDEELIHLSFYLKCLAENTFMTDTRDHNREAFGLYKLLEDQDVEQSPLKRHSQSPE